MKTELLSTSGMAGVRRGLQAVRAETPDMAEIRRLIGEIQSAHSEFRTANDQRLAQIEARGAADPVTTQQVTAINTRLGELQAALDTANQTIAGLRMGGGAGDTSDPAVREHRTAFAGYMRGTVEARGSTYSDPDGGLLVDRTTESGIERILSTTVAMRRLARIVAISGASYVQHKGLGGATSGWVGETETGSDRPETNTPNLASIEFTPGTLYAEPVATNDLLEDSAVSIEDWYADEVGIEFGEEEAAAFVSGNGKKKPRGFLSYDTVANASYAWGKIGFVVTGGASDFAASNPGDAVITLIHALKAGYRNNARFLTNDLTLAAIRKWKDGDGNYLWQPSAQAGVPSTLMGYGVETDDNMPDIAAGTFPLAFADWQRAYTIVDRRGIAVLRDIYKTRGLVHLYTTKRVGGGVSNFEAIKLMKVAAS